MAHNNSINIARAGRYFGVLFIIALIGFIIFKSALFDRGKASDIGASDATALDFINWGDAQQAQKNLYTGAGTTIAAMGYRDVSQVTGCDSAEAKVTSRRARKFATAASGIEQCPLTVAGLMAAQSGGNNACLAAIETAAAQWQRNWDPQTTGEQPYEFRDVYTQPTAASGTTPDLYDKVWTIEQLAGWPIGDPVAGFESSPAIWNQDFAGWDPSAVQASCPVKWLQCFDRKQPLYKGIPGLEPLGEQEGLCVVELDPEIKSQSGMWAHFDIIHEVAPDAQIVVASTAKNQEDAMSRAADWLIDNQQRFNIVAARFSNIVFLETALLEPGLQQFCGDSEWCGRTGQTPYNESCAGNPSAGGTAYAYKSMPTPPTDYLPIAFQFERMRDAGIVTVKGAGHEGWKGALPYPDCSPALLSVGVVFAGTLTKLKPEQLVEGGWAAQGWRWHPSWYCEEKVVLPGQVNCATNNAEHVGYGLADGTVASPLMVAHPFESTWPNLGNAWVSPYAVAAVAVIRSANLAPQLSALETVDLIHRTGDTVWDRRKCDQDPMADEPDGWLRVDMEFHDLHLEPLTERSAGELTVREQQLLDYPWAYVCSDAVSPDTAPYHTDNVADYSNRSLNIGAAVSELLKLR